MKRMLLLMIVLLTLGCTLRAQGALVGRIFVVLRGDLYSWLPGEAQPQRHTEGGSSADLVLSPNGEQIAYRRMILEGVEAYFYEAADLVIWDLRSDTHTLITEQPENITDGWISRSAPTWSPDGDRLAWTEWRDPSIAIRVYNLSDGSTATLSDVVNFGFADAGNYQDQAVGWGALITRDVFTFFEDSTGGTELSVYGETGRRCVYVIDQAVEPLPDRPRLRSRVQWVLVGDTWLLGLGYEGQPYRLMDAVTGEQWEIDTVPHRQARGTGDTAVRAEAVEEGWQVVWPASRVDPVGAASIAFAPDGQQVAAATYLDSGGERRWQVTVYAEAEAVDSLSADLLDGAGYALNLIWAPAIWTVAASTLLTPVEPLTLRTGGTCPPN